MLGFDKFFENKTLMFSAGAVAFLVAAILILFIFRLAFGRRLHMPGGGRARQPRLGVVDAFDLDRQRQLVLVRRDNVEHLVMIGGPNDVLIESQIVRVEARESPRSREKEPIVAPLAWPAGGPQSAGEPPPAIAVEPKLAPVEPVAAALPAPPLAPVAPPPVSPIAPQVSPIAPQAPAAAPAKRPPFLPLPPRRPITPPAFGFNKPVPPMGAPVQGEAPAPSLIPVPEATETAPPPSVAPAPSLAPAPVPFPLPPPRTLTNTPPAFLRPRPPVSPVAPPQVAPAPHPDETIASGAPEVAPPQPVQSEPPLKPADALESLEEEMAKLLGRGAKE